MYRHSRILIDVALLLGAAGTLPAAVHVLRPSGGDDTQLLQSTFDLCTTEPDCVVALEPGMFKTRQIVVRGFRGVIHGAGMYKTFVQPFGTLPLPGPVDWDHDPSAANPYPVLWTFINGDISISGIAFRATGENPVAPYANIPGYPGPKAATHLLALIWIAGQHADSSIDQCLFEGGKGTFPEIPGWPGFNLHMGVLHLSTATGDNTWLEGSHSITANQFLSAASGNQFTRLRNGRVVFGGAPAKTNVYKDTCAPTEMSNIDNVKFEFSYNFIRGCPSLFQIGIWLEQTPGSYTSDFPSSIFIANNYVQMYNGFGISVSDLVPDSAGRKADILISGNVVESLQNSGGISVMLRLAPLPANGWSAANAVVSQNTVVGESTRRAIIVNGARQTGVLNNDVSGFKSTMAPYLLQNTLSAIVSGASGAVSILGSFANTHTLVGGVTKE
jgi:hypothetical protein